MTQIFSYSYSLIKARYSNRVAKLVGPDHIRPIDPEFHLPNFHSQFDHHTLDREKSGGKYRGSPPLDNGLLASRHIQYLGYRHSNIL